MNKKIFLIISLFAVLTLPSAGLAVDFGNAPDIQTCVPGTPGCATPANFIPTFIGKVLDILWIVFIAFAIIMFIVAGFQFLAAQGEPDGVKKSQKSVLWGSIGVAVAVAAFVLPFIIRSYLAL